jgi:quercetin dioxygenase-like cupin family protein
MAENKDRHTDEFRGGLTRLPQLANPVICLNLEEELKQLHHAEAWNEASGRSAKTLAKYADFRVVLISMKAGTRMNQHHADGRISIQCLRGKLCIHLPSQAKAEMMAGGLLVLDCGIPHDVDAIEESAFLVTISWPGSHSSRSEE